MKLSVLILALFLSLFTLTATASTDFWFSAKVSGSGQPVILIPGLGCSGDVWTETVSNFPAGYQTHVLTLSGFAGEPAKEGSFLDSVKASLLSYIKIKNLNKPILIGHSLGGLLSLLSAAEHSGLFSGILVVDSYPYFSALMNPMVTKEQAETQAKSMSSMILSQDDETFLKSQRATMGYLVSSKENSERVAMWSSSSDRKTFAGAMSAVMTTDFRDGVKSISVPVTVLISWAGAKSYGFTEEMAIKNASTQYQNLTGVKIKPAKSALHFIMLDEPDWFMAELGSFLKEIK